MERATQNFRSGIADLVGATGQRGLTINVMLRSGSAYPRKGQWRTKVRGRMVGDASATGTVGVEV